MPVEVKGGTFSTADFALIKRALESHRTNLISAGKETDPDMTNIANLLHRLGRVS